MGKVAHRSARRGYSDRYAVLACVSSTLASVSAGYAIGFSSPALQDLRVESAPLHLSSEEASWFGSLLPLAAMFGSLASGPLMDCAGRRVAILVVIGLFLVSWTTMFTSVNIAMLFTGRALSGLATGMCTAVIPVYISEVSPAHLRGKMGTLFSVLLCMGIPVAYTASEFYGWKAMTEVGFIIGAGTFLICCLLPESPYWLLSKKKGGRAFDVLRRIRGPDADVAAEVKEIELLQDEMHEKFSWTDLTGAAFLKPVAIGVALMVFQQFSGINAIFFYAHDIFQRANFHNDNLASIIVSMDQAVVTFLATFVIDRAGRRKLLLLSSVGMLVCHAVLGGCMFAMEGSMVDTQDQAVTSSSGLLYIGNASTTPDHTVTQLYQGDLVTLQPNLEAADKALSFTAIAALSSIVLYIAFYSFGFGPIPYIVLTEMLPQRSRGVAGGVGIMSMWLCAFFITKTFILLVNLLTAAGVFWFFSSMCVLALVFVWRCVPETKGKTLAEIRDIFLAEKNKNIPASTIEHRRIVRQIPPNDKFAPRGVTTSSHVCEDNDAEEQAKQLIVDC